MYLLEMSGTKPIKSHQQDCPNMSFTRMAAINMPKQTGRSPRVINPTKKKKKLQATKEF